MHKQQILGTRTSCWILANLEKGTTTLLHKPIGSAVSQNFKEPHLVIIRCTP